MQVLALFALWSIGDSAFTYLGTNPPFAVLGGGVLVLYFLVNYKNDE